MDARLRLSFFCGTCFGLAIGGAAGHILVWNRGDATRVVFHDRIDPTYSASPYSATHEIGGLNQLVPLPMSEALDVASTPSPGGAVVLNDPDLEDELTHADALVEIPASAEAVTLPATPAPPSNLSVAQARPLAGSATPTPVDEPAEPAPTAQSAPATSRESSSTLDPEVVEMLKDELEGVSDQQREVWADALQGMSPADAAGIIVMWKKFGQNSAGPDHLSAPPPLFRSSHPDAAPTPLQPSALTLNLRETSQPSSPEAGHDLAARIFQHNWANRETCGYLDLIPVFRETAFESAITSDQTQVVGYRLKLEGNRFVKTGNPSHVALPHGHFFAVKLPSGEECYTRVGRLSQDAEHRLCIDLGDRDLPLSPEIILPEGTNHLNVNGGQLQVVGAGQPDPVPVGPPQVAVFFDATRLQPQGGCLYSATSASGQPKMVPAELTQETLEFPAPKSRATPGE